MPENAFFSRYILTKKKSDFINPFSNFTLDCLNNSIEFYIYTWIVNSNVVYKQLC